MVGLAEPTPPSLYVTVCFCVFDRGSGGKMPDF